MLPPLFRSCGHIISTSCRAGCVSHRNTDYVLSIIFLPLITAVPLILSVPSQVSYRRIPRNPSVSVRYCGSKESERM